MKDWIVRGAKWSGGPLDPLQYTSEVRAGYDWWSLQPLRRIEPPASSAWARNPIDAFVEQKLAAAKLAPSPAAEPNPDGSTTIYFAPTQPAGVKRGNWIQTIPGKGWFTLLRLYSPGESFFDKSWRPSEIEAQPR